MKKYIFIASALILCIFVIFIAAFHNRPEKPDSVSTGEISFKDMENIYDIADISSHIVLAKPLASDIFEGSVGEKMELKVLGNFKGETDENITVFVDQNAAGLEIGDSYILFLMENNSTVMPETTYSITEYNAIYRVKLNKLDGISKKADKFIEKYERKKLKAFEEDMISYSLENPEPVAEDTNKVYESPADIFNDADAVALVEVTSFYHAHQYADMVKLNTIEIYKGHAFTPGKSYIFPSDDERQIGNRYIVFFKVSEDGGALPLTRYDSIIGMSHPKWDETFQYLVHIQQP